MSEKETEPNLTTVRYDQRQTEIVESGAEAIEACLRDSDDAGRRSLLFCLDKYLDPYFGYELPYAEEIFGILQREVLRKRSTHVKEDAYELMRLYSGRRLEQLAERIGEVEPQMLREALDTLGCTFNPEYAPIVERFLEHEDPVIRSAAREASENCRAGKGL